MEYCDVSNRNCVTHCLGVRFEYVSSDSKRIQMNPIYRNTTGHTFRKRSHTQDKMGSRPKNDVVSISIICISEILRRVQNWIFEFQQRCSNSMFHNILILYNLF